MVNFRFSLLILIAAGCFSCKQKPDENKTQRANETNEQLIERTKASFKPVFNILYIEVYRRFANGTSFNENGYELKPSWRINFRSNSVAAIFSPIKKRFYDLPITLDHDSIFNMGGAWFRLLKLSKDSVKFRVLSVKNKLINWPNSNVFVTFYSADYLKTLPVTLAKLQQTTARDTAFIRNLIAKQSSDSTKTFEAQQPVLLQSKSSNVTVTNPQLKANILNNYYVPETLFYPEYNVVIHHAYANFNHSFAVQVKGDGSMSFIEPMEMLADGENTVKVMKEILNGYLKAYLNVQPGKTLGMGHRSNILITATGYTD